MAASSRPQTPYPKTAVSRWVWIRIHIAGAILTLLFAGIGYRAYDLQIRERDRFRELAARQHLKTVEVPAPRGAIFDRTGKELAVTAEIDSVFANPREIDHVASTAESLAEALGLDVRELEEKLSAPGYFSWIKRHVAPGEAAVVRDLELAGLALTREPRRFYPSGRLAGPVLGFAGIDGDGLDGIELTMDELLTGQQAKISAVRDAAGTLVLSDVRVKPEPGAAISLTLDRFVQFVSERALAQVVEAHEASAGLAIVIEVDTGEILAMANYPTYDPNSPGRAVQTGARNRVISDAYEIGSVMKIFTIAAALEAGVVTPSTLVDVENGRLRIGRKIIRDSFRDEELSIGGVMKRSSNVGAVKIARMLGKDRLREALVSYGFGARTDIELPGERSGLVTDTRRWGDTGLAAASFGYNVTVTPLQLAAALAAVGNGGVYYEPRIVREAHSAEGKLLYRREPISKQIMSEQTAGALLPMLASVFDKGKHGGTARNLDVDGFRAGGKSGTAKKVDPETRTYSDRLYISSFAGLAPIDDPKIAVLVAVDEPTSGDYYGSVVAGPAFATIVSATLRYLGVPSSAAADPAPAPDDEGAADREHIEPMEDAGELFVGPRTICDECVSIPDVTGMGLSRVLDVARDLGVAIDIEGSGRAVQQTPAPGWHPKPSELRVVLSRAHR